MTDPIRAGDIRLLNKAGLVERVEELLKAEEQYVARIAEMQAEATRHDTPAWQANERLNARVEICYMALERIIAEGAPAQFEAIAREALEAAALVL